MISIHSRYGPQLARKARKVMARMTRTARKVVSDHYVQTVVLDQSSMID